MDLCKRRGRPVLVYLRGLCEFPVRWLDFGPYPSVCICTVAAATPLLLVPAAFLNHVASQSRKLKEQIGFSHVNCTHLVHTR